MAKIEKITFQFSNAPIQRAMKSAGASLIQEKAVTHIKNNLMGDIQMCINYASDVTRANSRHRINIDDMKIAIGRGCTDHIVPPSTPSPFPIFPMTTMEGISKITLDTMRKKGMTPVITQIENQAIEYLRDSLGSKVQLVTATALELMRHSDRKKLMEKDISMANNSLFATQGQIKKQSEFHPLYFEIYKNKIIPA